MVRCSRPLTTYPARANRSKTLFWATCVAVKDEVRLDIGGAPNRSDHRSAGTAERDVVCDVLTHPSSDSHGVPAPTESGVGVRDVTRLWASMVGLAFRRRVLEAYRSFRTLFAVRRWFASPDPSCRRARTPGSPRRGRWPRRCDVLAPGAVGPPLALPWRRPRLERRGPWPPSRRQALRVAQLHGTVRQLSRGCPRLRRGGVRCVCCAPPTRLRRRAELPRQRRRRSKRYC